MSRAAHISTMHRKVLTLLILLMCLAAATCGLPRTVGNLEQKDVPLTGENRNTVAVKQENESISPNDTSETSFPKVGNSSTDVQKEGSDDQQENYTKYGMDLTKEDHPQRQQSFSVELPTEENLPKQETDVQEPPADEIHSQLKGHNTSTQLLQDSFQNSNTNKQEKQNLSTSASKTEDETQRQNQIREPLEASNNRHKGIHPALSTAESKTNKTIVLRKHLPKVSQSQRYQATSLKDFQEDSPGDVKKQEQKTKKFVLSGAEKSAETLKHLQLLESSRYNEQKQQSSSVVLSEPINLVSSTEEFDSVSSENPRKAGLLDVGPQHFTQLSSTENAVSSSNIKQEANTQEYYDPELYTRPHIAEDLVTTNNALDPKPSVTSYSPSLPVRTSIPQYAVREEHPDDLAPHHFAVAGHLPYALDRAKFIQYQQTASRYPYYVRVPLQRNFNVPYPVLVERKAQSFSLPLKMLVPPPIIVNVQDKTLYPATKPFSFRVHHETPIPSEDEHDNVGQRRSSSEGPGGHQS